MYDGKTSSYRLEIFREKIVSVVPHYDLLFRNSCIFYVYFFVKVNAFCPCVYRNNYFRPVCLIISPFLFVLYEEVIVGVKYSVLGLKVVSGSLIHFTPLISLFTP